MNGYENNNEKIMVAMDFRNVNTPLCEVAGDAPKDYSVLRETVLAGRPCNAIFAYDSLFRSGNRDQQQCTHDMLRDAGFTVRLSETPNKEDKQGHVDVFMALDVYRYVLNHDVDTVELITGDSDFLFERYEVYEEYMGRPFVSGDDLIKAGLSPGKNFSDILAYAHKLRLAGIEKESALKQTLAYAYKLNKHQAE